MPLSKSFLLKSSIFFALGLGLIFLFSSGPHNGMHFKSTSEVAQDKQLDSPDGRYRAYAFVADGGATTDWSPQVSVARKHLYTVRPFKTNVFRGYRSRTIDIRWVSSNELEITTTCNPDPKAEEILFRSDSIDGITIKYNFTGKKTNARKRSL